MAPEDLIADLRSRINPAYAATLGTESYERRLCAEAIEALIAERDMLRTGDTCARMCEGTAYRIEARQMRSVLADWLKFAADIQCGDACGQDWLDGLRTSTHHHMTPND